MLSADAHLCRLSDSCLGEGVWTEPKPGLVLFMDRLARLTAGRVLHVKDTDLGAFILRDYVTRREAYRRAS
jgi:hypothetical protein